MSSFGNIENFGVGVSMQDSYLAKLLSCKDLIHVLEIKPEHFFSDIPEYTKELHIMAEEFPLIAHGLFLSIGSFEGLNDEHLNKLQSVFEHSPPLHFMGEHMGFCRSRNIYMPHFSNIPYNDESLAIISSSILKLQKRLSLPIAFENIPWEFSYPESSMSEAEFFKRLVEETNTPLLLDVTNLYANQINHKWDIDEYFSKYPVQNLIQLHFNGGFINKDGIYIDSHSKPTPEGAWEIMELVMKMKAPLKAVILERDDNPDLDDLRPELERANELMRKYY